MDSFSTNECKNFEWMEKDGRKIDCNFIGENESGESEDAIFSRQIVKWKNFNRNLI